MIRKHIRCGGHFVRIILLFVIESEAETLSKIGKCMIFWIQHIDLIRRIKDMILLAPKSVHRVKQCVKKMAFFQTSLEMLIKCFRYIL